MGHSFFEALRIEQDRNARACSPLANDTEALRRAGWLTENEAKAREQHHLFADHAALHERLAAFLFRWCEIRGFGVTHAEIAKLASEVCYKAQGHDEDLDAPSGTCTPSGSEGLEEDLP